jgi:hypothetical protein
MTELTEIEALMHEPDIMLSIVINIEVLPTFDGYSKAYSEGRDITRRSTLLALETAGVVNIPTTDRYLLGDVIDCMPDYVESSLIKRFGTGVLNRLHFKF